MVKCGISEKGRERGKSREGAGVNEDKGRDGGKNIKWRKLNILLRENEGNRRKEREKEQKRNKEMNEKGIIRRKKIMLIGKNVKKREKENSKKEKEKHV